MKRELSDLELFEFRKKHLGWKYKTPDLRGRGHLWVFTGWRIIENDPYQYVGQTVDRATWTCLNCGLFMSMDCVFPNPRIRNLEPVPGSLARDGGGTRSCRDRFLDQFKEFGIREIMES